ncbi:MAG: F0F1 ATP synthase subunit B [Ignavibacteriaceae bacterium]|nr:F0F1 ATP synthase subunit B [Ignavibacteriaceae bacterium]
MFGLSIIALSALFASSEEGGSGSLLSVNYGLAFWTVLTFLLLLLILKKFAWKPILSALDEREQKIKDSLLMAEKANEEARQMIEENKKQLLLAEDEAKKIVEQSRIYADKLKTQLLEESKAQSQKLIENASQEIERKKLEAFDELKNQVADLSLSIAEKILKQNVDKNANAEMIKKYIDDIQKN